MVKYLTGDNDVANANKREQKMFDPKKKKTNKFEMVYTSVVVVADEAEAEGAVEEMTSSSGKLPAMLKVASPLSSGKASAFSVFVSLFDSVTEKVSVVVVEFEVEVSAVLEFSGVPETPAAAAAAAVLSAFLALVHPLKTSPA
ncbi:hypothetical protein TYRP_019815 [Tyrophagus putrescentiae]|nr:hypothetical protein TYRP_019815 [Tyrophagus putrescentiae]